MGKPVAEIEIDAALAQRLVLAQHPDLARLPIVAAGSGWDNVMFRLGAGLVLRLPRRAAAVPLILNEQRWLPRLAGRLPFAVPIPLRTGVAHAGYPWPWSIAPWIAGETADMALPDDAQGAALATFFEALHRPAPADAPRNRYRGVSLGARDPDFRRRVADLRCRSDLLARPLALWEDALAAPAAQAETWIHGDPHPRNVLVVDGRLHGMLDWGDMARGDRAADLAGVWLLLPARRAREQAMAECSATADDWRRARGWALLYAVILLGAGLSNDACMTLIAERTLRRLADDAA